MNEDPNAKSILDQKWTQNSLKSSPKPSKRLAQIGLNNGQSTMDWPPGLQGCQYGMGEMRCTREFSRGLWHFGMVHGQQKMAMLVKGNGTGEGRW